MADSKLFNNMIDAKTAINIINRFRKKYHHGVPETTIPAKLHASLSLKYKGHPINMNIPRDIELFRLRYLDSLTYKLPLTWGFSVLTWRVLPNPPKDITLEVFDKLDFASVTRVFLSVWSTGEEMYIVNKHEVKDFFAQGISYNKDFYIFPEEMQWCVIINHDDKILFSIPK
jgi:hypothetical protein